MAFRVVSEYEDNEYTHKIIATGDDSSVGRIFSSEDGMYHVKLFEAKCRNPLNRFFVQIVTLDKDFPSLEDAKKWIEDIKTYTGIIEQFHLIDYKGSGPGKGILNPSLNIGKETEFVRMKNIHWIGNNRDEESIDFDPNIKEDDSMNMFSHFTVEGSIIKARDAEVGEILRSSYELGVKFTWNIKFFVQKDHFDILEPCKIRFVKNTFNTREEAIKWVTSPKICEKVLQQVTLWDNFWGGILKPEWRVPEEVVKEKTGLISSIKTFFHSGKDDEAELLR